MSDRETYDVSRSEPAVTLRMDIDQARLVLFALSDLFADTSRWSAFYGGTYAAVYGASRATAGGAYEVFCGMNNAIDAVRDVLRNELAEVESGRATPESQEPRDCRTCRWGYWSVCGGWVCSIVDPMLGPADHRTCGRWETRYTGGAE